MIGADRAPVGRNPSTHGVRPLITEEELATHLRQTEGFFCDDAERVARVEPARASNRSQLLNNDAAGPIRCPAPGANAMELSERVRSR